MINPSSHLSSKMPNFHDSTFSDVLLNRPSLGFGSWLKQETSPGNIVRAVPLKMYFYYYDIEYFNSTRSPLGWLSEFVTHVKSIVPKICFKNYQIV